MVRKIYVVSRDDDLEKAKAFFDQAHFHHLLVLDNKRLQGIVSDRDLLKELSPYLGTPAEMQRDTHTLHKKVHQIMSRELVTISPDASILEAINLFLSSAKSCLPVVDHDRHPVGILSWRDVFRYLASLEK